MAYADTIVEAYDFEAERWVSLTEKPSVTFGAEACYMKGKLLTIGGVQSKQVDQYDLETNTWAPHFPRKDISSIRTDLPRQIGEFPSKRESIHFQWSSQSLVNKI